MAFAIREAGGQGQEPRLGLVWGHTLSRLAPVVLIRLLPYAGDPEHAKAKPLATRVSSPQLLAAVLVTGAVVLGLWAVLDHLGWPWRTWARASISGPTIMPGVSHRNRIGMS